MGWSCTQLADDVMDRIMALSHQSDKKALIKGTDGRYYFIEGSHREYDDGHITGSVFLAVQSDPPYAPLRPGDDDSRFKAKKIGGLDISPCGEIRKLPKVISGLLRGSAIRNPMKLMTKAIAAKLPPLYSQDHNPDPIVWVKFFCPWNNWKWYATEFDGVNTFFGMVHGSSKELGYFTLAEFQSVRGPGGLGIERDLYWRPVPLSRINN